MNYKANQVLRILFLALIAIIILKLLGVAIKFIVSIVIPLGVLYALYIVLIKNEKFGD